MKLIALVDCIGMNINGRMSFDDRYLQSQNSLYSSLLAHVAFILFQSKFEDGSI